MVPRPHRPSGRPPHFRFGRVPVLFVPVVLTALLVVGSLPASGVDTDLDITNSAPVVDSVTLPSSEVTPTAGTTTAVTATILATDLNGCNDIQNVAVTVQKPDGSTHIAATDATYQSCSAGVTATYTYAFNMNHYDAPALELTQYKIYVVATDLQSATGSNIADLMLFNYLELVAVNVAAAALDFGGPLNPGDQSGIVDLSVENHGNVAIDTQLSGTDLAHATEAASIPVASAAYSLASDMSGSSALSGTATTLTTNIAAGASSSDSLYWRLGVPSAEDQWVPSGNYAGSLTVTAVKNSS